MCRTHGVAFEEKFVKARNIVDAVVEEAKAYDLLALGASTEWRLTQFAFGPWQDQIARRTETPTLMVRKVRRKEEPVPTRNPVPLPTPPPPQPSLAPGCYHCSVPQLGQNRSVVGINRRQLLQ